MTIKRPAGYPPSAFEDIAEYVAEMTGTYINKITGFEVQFSGSAYTLRHVELLMALAV